MPLIHDFVCTSAEKTKFQDGFRSKGIHGSGLCMSCDGQPDPYAQYELKKTILYCISEVDETNQNLTNTQRDFLHWYQKLCIKMHDLQQLIRPQKMREQRVNIMFKRPPVVPIMFKSNACL